MGSKGVVSSLISAFIIVNVYKFCICTRDHQDAQGVPGTIAQSFRDIFAFGFSIIICAAIDFVCRATIATPFANLVSTLMSPLFSAVDSYAGMAFISGAVALFQFMGIHGASVVMTPLNAALYGNPTINLEVFQRAAIPPLPSRRLHELHLRPGRIGRNVRRSDHPHASHALQAAARHG